MFALFRATIAALPLFICIGACSKDNAKPGASDAGARTSVGVPTANTQGGAAGGLLTVTSTSLVDGKAMPEAHACKREAPNHKDVSPQIAWTAGPPGTAYYAIEMLDLDAPNVPNDWDKETKNFLHWRILNIAPETLSIAQSQGGVPPQGALGIENHFGVATYSGPCPPNGAAHRYAITVYAMSKRVPMNVPIQRANVLAQGTLTATYAR